MAIHIAPLTATAYWYDRPDGHEQFDKPVATLTLQYLDLGVMEASNLAGRRMTRAMHRELRDALVAAGIVELRVVRHRRVKTYHKE